MVLQPVSEAETQSTHLLSPDTEKETENCRKEKDKEDGWQDMRLSHKEIM